MRIDAKETPPVSHRREDSTSMEERTLLFPVKSDETSS